jgi:hypothetical protein
MTQDDIRGVTFNFEGDIVDMLFAIDYFADAIENNVHLDISTVGSGALISAMI